MGVQDYFTGRAYKFHMPPVRRAAYSDRTAWLMAEMSRLAYFAFEKDKHSLENIKKAVTSIADAVEGESDSASGQSEIQRKLDDILGKLDAMDQQGESEALLDSYLDLVGFDLVATFDNEGTQAFLARRDFDSMAVLAFRGTEVTSLEDIKADLDLRFKIKVGKKAASHQGFANAYQAVAHQVSAAVNDLSGHSIYITGHSLGAALAIVAAHDLNADNIAVVYTYGGPRVGNRDYGQEIKPPIYRAVNAADIVTHLPFGVFMRFLAKVIPPLEKFRGYRHYGDMRYINHCFEEDYSDVQVIPNLGQIDRIFLYIGRMGRVLVSPRSLWGKGYNVFASSISDHSIDLYGAKLLAYARKRNSIN